MEKHIKILSNSGYQYIEVGEVYAVQSESIGGYYIKVFGIEFHILKEDCEEVRI